MLRDEAGRRARPGTQNFLRLRSLAPVPAGYLSQIRYLQLCKAFVAIGLICFALVPRVEAESGEGACLGAVPGAIRTTGPVAFPDPGHRSGAALNGMSTLFFFDDDRTWKQTPLIERLKQGGVRALRYPGGEVADNYRWDDHSVEQPGLWPGAAATEERRAQRTDFREFLAHAERIGARDLFFVVNVDGIFRSPEERDAALERYALSAAAWVRAANESGKRVRYWEIGNEPYHLGYPLTVKEYAQVLKVFSKHMRSADPSILIGAAGPMHVNSVGFADQIDEQALVESRRVPGGARGLCKGLSRPACADRLMNGRPAPSDLPRWWPTLISEAGDAFDFAVVHSYALSDVAVGSTAERFRLTERVTRLKKLLKDKKARDVPVSMTEWNTPNFEGPQAEEIEHLMEIAIQLGGFAVAGLDHALYWPMRSPAGRFPAAYDDAGEPTAVGLLLQEIHELINGVEAVQAEVGGAVYAYVAKGESASGAILVNRGIDAIGLPLSSLDAVSGSLVRFSSHEDGRVAPLQRCDFESSAEKSAAITLPPRSITVMRSRADGR